VKADVPGWAVTGRAGSALDSLQRADSLELQSHLGGHHETSPPMAAPSPDRSPSP
jgi:hypothetical protein